MDVYWGLSSLQSSKVKRIALEKARDIRYHVSGDLIKSSRGSKRNHFEIDDVTCTLACNLKVTLFTSIFFTVNKPMMVKLMKMHFSGYDLKTYFSVPLIINNL